MKRRFCILILCLCVVLGLQAQVIQNGSRWWDGSVLYTAKVDAYGDVTMEGIDAHEGGFIFRMAKSKDMPGRYQLAADMPDAFSARNASGVVDYIRQDGMYFLAIRNKNNDVMWTMLLTPDNLTNCTEQEKYAEGQPVSDIITGMLLNTTYLGRFPKAQLRLMRNEILARHGWTFQSKDLRDYFGSQSWYQPLNSNNTIKLNIIEQTNVQLIKSEETVPDDYRSYLPKAEDFPGGLADDGKGPDIINGETVYMVDNEADFFAALGNDRTIYITGDVHLNLSRILENQMYFMNTPRCRWSNDALSIQSKETLVVSEPESDGRQLALLNFRNLIIKGEHNSSIEVDPRYSYCLNFINCEHCEIHNLTIGHTEGGVCSGGVICVRGGRKNVVKDCDLYGCGTYGLDLIETSDFNLLNSNVHDCTYGIMQLRNASYIRFTDCDFFSNREYTLIESTGSESVSFEGCRFYANNGNSQLFDFDSSFYMAGCEIYHPTEHVGTINMAEQTGAKNKFFSNPLDMSIKGRGIGPH